jgi:hypothetical protein
MNRIYQGRVSKVEIFTGDKENPGQPLGYWLSNIGHSAKPPHHELFQDAVNSLPC